MVTLKKHTLFLSITIFVLILDQLTKWFVQTSKLDLLLIPPLVSFTYSTNKGAGFGILQGQTMLLLFVSLLVICFILFYYPQLKQPFHAPVALILGGAVGNFLDRLLFHYVRDFIVIWIWPSFNVADSAITIGVAWLIWMELLGKKDLKTRKAE